MLIDCLYCYTRQHHDMFIGNKGQKVKGCVTCLIPPSSPLRLFGNLSISNDDPVTNHVPESNPNNVHEISISNDDHVTNPVPEIVQVTNRNTYPENVIKIYKIEHIGRTLLVAQRLEDSLVFRH